jgi:hypothetical protein
MKKFVTTVVKISFVRNKKINAAILIMIKPGLHKKIRH